MPHPTSRTLILAAAAALALVAAPVAAQVAPPSLDPPVSPPALTSATGTPQAHGQAGGQSLVGTFRLAAGSCTGDGAGGSYFRMTQPAGQPIDNGDSPCDDKSYTPLEPGTDGGLVTGAYQPHPDPAFDGNGNGVNDKLTKPAAFYGVDFSTATNPTDPQTDTEVAAPEIVAASDGSLSGDLRAFAAAWNGQHFNQGSPKPDGETPEGTEGPTGSYDEGTGAFEMEWSSRISGGPFNNFIGTWHFEGTFEPSSQPQAQSNSGPSASDSSAGAPASTSSPPAAASRPGATASTAGAQATHPRTGPSSGISLAGTALLGAFAATSVLRRRTARATATVRASSSSS